MQQQPGATSARLCGTYDMAMQIRLETIASLFSEGSEHVAPQDVLQAQVEQNARRAALLHETTAQKLARRLRVIARALNPQCLATIAPAFDLLWHQRLQGVTGLPDPDKALARPDGLAGLAPDLSPATLLAAYGRGLHPRCLMGPATFWAPAQRRVAHPANLALTQGLRSMLHKRDNDVTIDHDFDGLMLACGSRTSHLPRLSPKMMRAHAALFDSGAAHCFEVWDRQGKLVGGGYGIAFGKVFVIERMFGTVPDMARLGIVVLARHLAAWGFRMLDGSFVDDMVKDMGFAPQKRSNYNASLDANAMGGKPGRWRIDPAIYAPRAVSTGVRHLFDPPPPAVPALAAAGAELLDGPARDLPHGCSGESRPNPRAA